MTKFYVQRVKWTSEPSRVTITHTGPFNERTDAQEYLKKLRKKKHTDITIIEKSNAT